MRIGNRKLRALAVVAAISIVALGSSRAALAAEPVNITYGYHPYWTGGWNGVIIKAKELWKKHLPPGSQVRFEPHLTGPPMVNAMLADRMQIGTMGDMPSLVATTKGTIGDIRLVSVPMYSKGQNCTKILVRKDAPEFKDPAEAMAWMNGKPFAVHRGTCANASIQAIIDKGVFKPSELQYTPIEVIASNFEAKKLDAAIMWEPHARRQVEAGHARYVATGAAYDAPDADFTLMRQDFIQKNPEAAAGWIKAEIEAVQFMINNPRETAQIIAKELTGYDEKTAWAALYEENPKRIGGDPVNYVGKMGFDQDVMGLMKRGYEFLYKIKAIDKPDMPANAINDEPLKRALKELNAKIPLGEIKGQPRGAFK
jgi:ABC-type nitrate/sulfonate/bicarbonate transport system substrate-binding protein